MIGNNFKNKGIHLIHQAENSASDEELEDISGSEPSMNEGDLVLGSKDVSDRNPHANYFNYKPAVEGNHELLDDDAFEYSGENSMKRVEKQKAEALMKNFRYDKGMLGSDLGFSEGFSSMSDTYSFKKDQIKSNNDLNDGPKPNINHRILSNVEIVRKG